MFETDRSSGLDKVCYFKIKVCFCVLAYLLDKNGLTVGQRSFGLLISRTCFECFSGCPDETFHLSTRSMVRFGK